MKEKNNAAYEQGNEILNVFSEEEMNKNLKLKFIKINNYKI